MAARVKAPQVGGQRPTPVSSTASVVGTAQPAKVRTPRLIGDWADKSTSDYVINTTQNAFAAGVNIIGDIKKTADARATMETDTAFQSVQNKFLYDPNGGLKTRIGRDALDHMSGASATGDDVGKSLVDQYREKLKTALAKTSVGMSNLAREAAQLQLDTAVLEFDKNVGQYAIKQQKVADEATLASALAAQLGRIGDAPSDAQTLMDVREKVKGLMLHPQMGAIKQAGLNADSDDPEVQRQVDQILADADSGVMREQITQLINRGLVTEAKNVFNNSKSLLNGKDKGELSAVFLKLNDATVYLDKFQRLLIDSTDKETQSIDRRKMIDSIRRIKDPKLQKAMNAYFNEMNSQERTVIALSEKKADTEYLNHKIAGLSAADILKKNPALIARLSPDMRGRIVTALGATATLKAAKAVGALSEEEAHVEKGGLSTSDPSTERFDAATILAAKDPPQFLEEFSDPKDQIRGLTLDQSEKVSKLVTHAIEAERRLRQRVGEKDPIKLAASVLTQMGYDKKLKKYEKLYRNVDVQNLIMAFVNDHVDDTGRVPNATQINEHMSRLMLEVIRPTPWYTPDKTEIFFKLSHDPAAIDNEIVDVSGAKDRQRLATATGFAEGQIVQAIKDLDKYGVGEPTYRDLRGRLEATRLGLPKTLDVIKATHRALSDGVPLQALMKLFDHNATEFTLEGVEEALKLLHNSFPDEVSFKNAIKALEE